VLLFNSIKLSRITVFVDEITSPVTSSPPVIYTLPSVQYQEVHFQNVF
jgi:hypothetical protein